MMRVSTQGTEACNAATLFAHEPKDIKIPKNDLSLRNTIRSCVKKMCKGVEGANSTGNCDHTC